MSFYCLPIALSCKDSSRYNDEKATWRYDNKQPRAQQATLTGIGARAVAAHQNSFESLIIFSTATLTAIATHNTSCLIQGLAIFHLISRGIYHLFYLLNWATLRSTLWTLGCLSSLGILWLCIP
ncbi:MAPEG family protein [Legionella feeleii]|uniref:MAPEG family protein n=1 Tax=Legionella feeleii TaxID=453 RepID=UPI0030B816F0